MKKARFLRDFFFFQTFLSTFVTDLSELTKENRITDEFTTGN
ncbi:MAG: hypothetical protein Q4F85_09310 [Prevotella sp.]|nr:hypothetical protein [Prevotella sp.]